MAKRKRIVDKRTKERKQQDRIIYRLGFMAAEDKYKKIIAKQVTTTNRMTECFKAANKRLWDEIRGLDKECPIDKVYLKLEDARDIVSCLRAGVVNESQAARLRRKIKKIEDTIASSIAEFFDDISLEDKD